MSRSGVAPRHRKILVKEAYPMNLLLSLQKTSASEIALTDKITDDVLSGVEYALSFLNEREYNVLAQRFRERKTYAEIGKSLGISYGRVRQIEMQSFRKLREPTVYYYILNGLSKN